MRRILPLLIACLVAPLLSGCIGLAATGVGAAAFMVDDRRTAGTYVEDENIEWKVFGIVRDRFKGAHVNATSYNRKVLLTGEVADDAARKALEDAVRGVPSVVDVANELIVAGNSSLASRGNDSAITGNVKSRMLGNGKFSPNHVKVVTEAGTVFLLGLVTAAEADAAVEIARSTAGVTRVVKVFEILPAAK